MARRKRKRGSLSGSVESHTRDAQIFAKNTRRALQSFNKFMRNGNCTAAYHELLVAHLRGGEYKLSREFTGSRQKRRNSSSGAIRALVNGSMKFERGCIVRKGR